MKKVGIVSCYFKHNYGSMLQAYATQEILNNLNIENETIDISQNVDFSKGKKKYYLSQVVNIPFIQSKLGMIKLKIDKKVNKKLGSNISARDKKYEEFKRYFKLSPPYKTYEELNKVSNDYSSIIVGSDQLWLPVNVVADYYTLNWVSDDVNKMSLSTSFGISDIPVKYRKKYSDFLNRMDAVSVREQSGLKLVKDLSNREAELVCDPTLLLTKGEWINIIPENRIIEDDYILCYFLGKNIEHRKFAERLKAKTGLKIVSINHGDEYVKYSDIYADETPYDVGPGDWINLIRHAKYVCTDSFHGTVFSLINNVEFFSFNRYDNSDEKISTNTRVQNLLRLFNLSERLLQGNEDIEKELSSRIDFEEVNKQIENHRKDGIRFIKDNIK